MCCIESGQFFLLISFLLLYSVYVHVCRGPGGSMSQVVGLPNNSYKPITNTARVRTRLCKLQKGCTRFAAATIKFTSCLLMVGGSLRVLLLPPLKLVAMIQLKVALSTKNQINSLHVCLSVVLHVGRYFKLDRVLYYFWVCALNWFLSVLYMYRCFILIPVFYTGMGSITQESN